MPAPDRENQPERDDHSSSSEEDHNAVEVSFDPSCPYRRKSSLVNSDVRVPVHLRRAQTGRTECLVHQFLDSQRRPPRRQNTLDGQLDGTASSNTTPVEARNPLARGLSDLACEAVDATRELGHDRVPDPKGISSAPGNTAANGRARECSMTNANSSDTSDTGQIDEKEWKSEIVKATCSDSTQQPSTDLHEKHSRLLTKKQLSEMAWGVRELSRRLGSVRLKFKIKTIFVLTKPHDQELVPKTRDLLRWLLDKERDVRYTVYIDKELRGNKKFDALGLLEEVRKDYVESGEISEEASHDIAQRLRYWDEEMCRTRPQTADFVITLGGDGTVLFASWLFQRIVPPVLSFALGSLGFLTKFDFDKYQETLTAAFTEGVNVALRLRFEGTVMRSQKKRRKLITDGPNQGQNSNETDGKPDGTRGSYGQNGDDQSEEDEEEEEKKRDLVEELIGEEKDDERTHRPDGTFEVLNEVVVDRGPNPTMSYIEIFGDDEHFTSVHADGICVSTPTGSTAYNLAAGGSLCHPENPVMLVTAICAHTLSFRPIILPDTIVLRIGVPYDARTSSWASFDGRERIELRPGDYVTISASRYPFASVQVQGRRSEEWIKSINAKLGWNTRQKQKSFT
ncbi:ATP-NAD kinase-like domain-containing protein [Sordaria brevicollis]|uniref:ATP-NAD kinase-like domain-containing protein n=1 Tax=Sordaria brevicollis TaxID=83679 RepID=A0AAE0UH06_SORBR|nr:ATP-NAD kinase-like domain-containing protein [Sordaria brevicollis]